MSRSYEVVDRNLTADDLRLQARKVIGCLASSMHASKPNRISKGNQRLVDALDAGAAAMDSLAAMRAQRDRLAEALGWAVQEIAHGGHSGMAIDCWLRDARAALAELEGGAS